VVQFGIDHVPYGNYPGRCYEGLVQVVCECGWRGPGRDLNFDRDRLLVAFDQNEHETCQAEAEAV
jgi:hypothetical protein